LSLDETGALTKMGRLYGRCAYSERLRADIPHGHWKTNHLRCWSAPGRLYGADVAGWADDRAWFLAYVEQI
jgi:hypothetical protein